MKKVQPMPEQLQKESKAMVDYTSPFVAEMMRAGTLTLEEVEILSLLTSAQHGFCEVMKKLLTTAQANVNKADPVKGNTALHSAASHGQLEMVKLLLFFGAKHVKNKDGNAPSDLARDKHLDVYQCLCESEKVEGMAVELAGNESHDSNL